MAETTENKYHIHEEEDLVGEEEGGTRIEGEKGGGAGKKRKRPLNNKGLGGFSKRGVCYLSRVPPHMNPSHVHQIVSKYGEVQRVYLVPEGGKKRSSFYYDIWNIKYLRKFKWDDLVGEIAEKTHIREQKLTLDITAAKKQRDHYLSNAEKSRTQKFIRERIKKNRAVEERGPNKKAKLSKNILSGVFGGSS
ncbi:hypothetical protein ZWY2020_044958 [Hordeum vulgare]|nr:hypothetical protein ZWY2020_044958 [Hordeum vulgare]